MEAKIKAELRGRDPSKVKRLRLVSCHSQSIVGITTEFTSLRFLSITYSGLISITVILFIINIFNILLIFLLIF